jgi:hypothetical protein
MSDTRASLACRASASPNERFTADNDSGPSPSKEAAIEPHVSLGVAAAEIKNDVSEDEDDEEDEDDAGKDGRSRMGDVGEATTTHSSL